MGSNPVGGTSKGLVLCQALVRSLALVIENQSAESGVSSLAVLRRCGSASSIYPPATLIAPRHLAGATYVIWPYFTDDADTIVGMRTRRDTTHPVNHRTREEI